MTVLPPLRTLLFLLEEASAKWMLQGLIETNFKVDPQSWDIQYKVFEGKQDLEKHLSRVLSRWRTPYTTFFIVRDQDAGDCTVVKESIRALCPEPLLQRCVIRIACRELESFYLGDLSAVENGLQLTGLAQRQSQRKFRDPDNLQAPSKELETLTKSRYQKIGGSRSIAPHLSPQRNRSHSFKMLFRAIRDILSSPFPSDDGRGNRI